MIYLASPYSHADATVRERRFQAVCVATASLILEGRPVFSPIVHSHPLVRYGLPTDWSFWRSIDLEHLVRCDSILVLMLNGWDQSIGVREEIRFAREHGKPVNYIPVGRE